ncbi:hypothetical protein [Streptomyces sp. NPDC013187]|uniref:hypothetical protein n=1 Tax=Streptomyces sp. NPDC013187 TaxID=3364865 RepID=UPI0036AF9ABE
MEHHVSTSAQVQITQDGTTTVRLHGLAPRTPFRFCLVDKRGRGVAESPESLTDENGVAAGVLPWTVDWSKLRCVVLLPLTSSTIELPEPAHADRHRPTYTDERRTFTGLMRRGLKESGLEQALSRALARTPRSGLPAPLRNAVEEARGYGPGRVLVIQERAKDQPVFAVYHQAPHQRPQLVEQVSASAAGPWQGTSVASWPAAGSADTRAWEIS